MPRKWLLAAALAVGVAGMSVGLRAGAEETAVKKKTEAPAKGAAAPASPGSTCGPHVKVVVPTVEKRKNTRICYECKEEDYVSTRCVPSAIPSHECPTHEEGHGGLLGFLGRCLGKSKKPDVPGCIQCEKPGTRRVLIKKVITEEILVPACKVERVPVVPCPLR